MVAGYGVERIGQRDRDRCAILQRLRDQLNHLVVHLLELAKCAFESSFVIAMLRKIYPQSHVIMDDAAQFGSYRFFEQAGTSIKVADGVAVGYNHQASLVVLAESRRKGECKQQPKDGETRVLELGDRRLTPRLQLHACAVSSPASCQPADDHRKCDR